MAIVIRQTTIWQEIERELPPGLEELEAFLAVLSEFDGELVGALQRERGHGRGDFPLGALFNALAVQLYLRHRHFSELLAELRRNGDLARLLGFEEIGPNRYRIPSKSAISRFHKKLKSATYRVRLRRVFDQSVAALRREVPEFGKRQALDASDVRTHARPPRRDRADESGERRIPSSDPEASWSVKTKVRNEGEGKGRKETRSTFGYKLYASADVSIPAVVAVGVESGSVPDHHMALPMLRAAKAAVPDRIETVAMDKGFDSEENVAGAFELGIGAVVPVREVPEELKERPREDRERPLVCGGNVVFDPYLGDVACYAPASDGRGLQRRQLLYAGFERKRETHKFRCPLGASAATDCRAFASCAAGPSGAQGRQVRVPMALDVRRFAPVYPRSKRWKRLYNGRSAVERINSYLKEVLQLEEHCLRGKDAIEIRALLATTTVNVRTLVSLRAAKAATTAA